METYNILCEILSNENILAINYRNAHWNVSGIDFKPVHSFLDDLYNNSSNTIDAIAERIKMIGYDTPANYSFYLENTSLTNEDFFSFDSKSIFEKLSKDVREYIDILSNHIKTTDLDLGTENYLLNLLETKEKDYWFINSHLQ